MPFRISGKNLDIGEALRERIAARVAEALEKYFHGTYSGHVTVDREGFGFSTECAIHLASGITLESEATAADAYASADQAVMRIEKRLRRYKRRLKDRSAAHAAQSSEALLRAIAAPSYVIESPEHDDEPPEEFHPVIIAESTTSLERMPVNEAVQELDFRGAAVMVFRHAGHGRINVVYRRPDGHIGWIDPPLIPADDAK
jgi:ribosomal subunit interface protein